MKTIIRKWLSIGILISASTLAIHVNATILDFEGIASAGTVTSYNNQTLTHNGFDIFKSHGHVISSTYFPTLYNNHNANHGSDWLMHDSGGPQTITLTGGGDFSIQSMEYASYRSDSGNVTITGTYSAGGTIVDTILFTPFFATYNFSSAWIGLSSINFQGFGGASYDNIVLNEASVPEPTTLALLGLGIFGLGFSRRKRLQ